MSTDKTLADVQPGGRVRLGDAPWPEIDAILADAYSAGAEGLPFEGIARRAAVRKAVAALAAQPSPGGQGDALVQEALEYFERAGDAGDRKYVAAIRAALTQAQMLESQLKAAVEAAEIVQRRADRAARQPVGEVVVTKNDAGQIVAVTRQDDEHRILSVIAESAPVQAVNLPYSLDADPAGIRARVCDVITGALMVGAQGHTTPPAGHWAEPFWQAARADAASQAINLWRFRPFINAQRHEYISHGLTPEDDCVAECDELLALIDSQAVGNG